VGNLEVRRDLSDVRDVVVAYRAALAQGEAGAVYNVCAGRVVSLREILTCLIDLATVPVEVVPEGDRRRPRDIGVLAGNSRAFRLRTGWQPIIPLERTLQDLLAYWRGRTAGGGPGASPPSG
jgi:GDP-4-dehydro-6-deoxy-D-mannose reductase